MTENIVDWDLKHQHKQSRGAVSTLFFWFDSLRTSQQFFNWEPGLVFLGRTSTKQGLMYFAKCSAVKLVRLEPTTPRSRVKYWATALPLNRLANLVFKCGRVMAMDAAFIIRLSCRAKNGLAVYTLCLFFFFFLLLQWSYSSTENKFD